MLNGYIGALLPFLMHEGSRVRFRGHADAGEVFDFRSLMGFPDGHTAIPWRKKPASERPDGPRYRALGNSWAVNCARWIGERIASVDCIAAANTAAVLAQAIRAGAKGDSNG